MEDKKDWIEEIGNIKLEISHTSGEYDLAFLMGYGWYGEIEKIVEQIKQEAQIEVLTEIFQTCYQEDSKTLELVEEKLSKLTTK